MILAAGYGTRLRPITYLLPKPMVPVCNRPLIAYAVEQYLRAGIREIVVNLHHLPEPIELFLADGFDARFHFSREPEILGTGGGVRKVRPLLEGHEDFFLVNADTIQFPDYEALRSARGDALAALTLRHPPEGDRFTPVYFANGAITGFGKGTGEALMFSGSHCISSRIFRWLPEKEFSGIVDEAYEPAMAQGERVVGMVDDDERWFDIGTPRRYMSASRSVLALTLAGELEPARGTRIEGDSLVHESARATGVVRRSVVGARSVVEGSLDDTVVWDGCRIAAGVVLRSCVVAHDVELKEPTELENAVICRASATTNGIVMAEM
jgi:NDP-sugar pyrophosphorylase family protein